MDLDYDILDDMTLYLNATGNPVQAAKKIIAKHVAFSLSIADKLAQILRLYIDHKSSKYKTPYVVDHQQCCCFNDLEVICPADPEVLKKWIQRLQNNDTVEAKRAIQFLRSHLDDPRECDNLMVLKHKIIQDTNTYYYERQDITFTVLKSLLSAGYFKTAKLLYEKQRAEQLFLLLAQAVESNKYRAFSWLLSLYGDLSRIEVEILLALIVNKSAQNPVNANILYKLMNYFSTFEQYNLVLSLPKQTEGMIELILKEYLEEGPPLMYLCNAIELCRRNNYTGIYLQALKSLYKRKKLVHQINNFGTLALLFTLSVYTATFIKP